VKTQGKPVKKLGSGSRATFISPYLRRPLRPLDKVLSERSDPADEEGHVLRADGPADEAGSATWGLLGKPGGSSD
jgi:hypothetical protein